jgi:hypothetical protein
MTMGNLHSVTQTVPTLFAGIPILIRLQEKNVMMEIKMTMTLVVMIVSFLSVVMENLKEVKHVTMGQAVVVKMMISFRHLVVRVVLALVQTTLCRRQT